MKKIPKVILLVVIIVFVILEITNVVYYYRYKKPNLDRIKSGEFAPWDLGRSYEYKPWIINLFNSIFDSNRDKVI